MRLLAGLGTVADYRGGYVSIGNFDGVHRGHQAMMAQLRQRADSSRVPAVVLTFDPHPSALLRPEATPPLITTLSHRAELLAEFGADFVIAIPVDPLFLQLTAEQFFRDIVLDALHAKGLVEGPNFFFGHNRTGNVTMLKHFCTSAGLSLDVVAPVTVNGQLVSSSVIRTLLRDGDLNDAIDLLGHPYRLAGVVGSGAKRGRQIGVPTANLADVSTVVPAHGVYAGSVTWDRIAYRAAINIGPNPTFGDETSKIEIHLLDFQGDLYGKPLSVDLVRRIRDVRKFESVEELQRQLADDLAIVRQSV